MGRRQNRGTIATLLVLGLVLVVWSLTDGRAAAAENAACPPMPTLPWWTTATHAKTIAFVKRRYGGNWDRYIEAWQTRRDALTEALADRRTVVLQSAEVTLEGRALVRYIGHVTRRLDVIRCLARTQSELAQPGDPKRGRNIALRDGCFACHGKDGRGLLPDAPHLAAQKVWYLRGQLWTFAARDDAGGSPLVPRRSHAAMDFAAHRLAPEEIADVAAYYATQPCVEPVSPRATTAPAQSEQCFGCHGADGIGSQPEIPNLAGQKIAYIERQLALFGRGLREPRLAGDGPLRYHFSMRQDAQVDGLSAIGLANYFSRQSCP